MASVPALVIRACGSPGAFRVRGTRGGIEALHLHRRLEVRSLSGVRDSAGTGSRLALLSRRDPGGFLGRGGMEKRAQPLEVAWLWASFGYLGVSKALTLSFLVQLCFNLYLWGGKRNNLDISFQLLPDISMST